jgi:5-(carboxyamino)imidazole ribonucleotide synthase
MLCGLPSGNCDLISPAVMVNLLGDVWGSSLPHWDTLLVHPNIKLHLYGKQEARPGRKMGHFNVLANSTQQAMELAEKAFQALQSD